jgi:hypothetical protein
LKPLIAQISNQHLQIQIYKSTSILFILTKTAITSAEQFTEQNILMGLEMQEETIKIYSK